MNDDSVMKPPAYLLRNIERQQQALSVVQMQVQQALNLAGEWLAGELGMSLDEVIQKYDFDGKAFRPRQSGASEST